MTILEIPIGISSEYAAILSRMSVRINVLADVAEKFDNYNPMYSEDNYDYPGNTN
jgi:hypothetical protein